MRAETLEAGCPDEETVAKYRTMSRGCLNLHRQLLAIDVIDDHKPLCIAVL